MVELYCIRHGATQWNADKRLQGRADTALSAAGRQTVARWQLPPDLARWYASPLLRARQTAECLHLRAVRYTDALLEMDWGDWEGHTLAELTEFTTSHGTALATEQIRGRAMQPPNGESPAAVIHRLQTWLATLPTTHPDSVTPPARYGIITHKGVLRAALALATDWDMRADHAVTIRTDVAYQFDYHEAQLTFVKAIALLATE